METLLPPLPAQAANDNATSGTLDAQTLNSQGTRTQTQEAVQQIYEQNLQQLARQKVRPFVPESMVDEVVSPEGRIDYAKLNEIMATENQQVDNLIFARDLLNIRA